MSHLFHQFLTTPFDKNSNLDELNQRFRTSLLAYGSETEDNLLCANNLRLALDENQTIQYFLLESQTKLFDVYELLLKKEEFSEPIRRIIEILQNYSTIRIASKELEKLSDWAWAKEEEEKPDFLPITQNDWETWGRFTTLILQNLYENLSERRNLLDSLNAHFSSTLLFQKSMKFGNIIFIKNYVNDFSIGEIELIFDEKGFIRRYDIKIWNNEGVNVRFFEATKPEELFEKIQEKLVVLGLLDEEEWDQIKEIFENDKLSFSDKEKETEKLIEQKLILFHSKGISKTQSMNSIINYLCMAA